MRRVVVIALAGVSLAGCSSLSLDAFKPTPPAVNVQLESVPPGAEARTSVGPSCQTPCSVAVPAAENFSVTFTLEKFEPVTVPVQVVQLPGDFTTPASTKIDPNPVVAELRPMKPVRPARKQPPRKPRPPKAAAAEPAGSPFPEPAAPAR